MARRAAQLLILTAALGLAGPAARAEPPRRLGLFIASTEAGQGTLPLESAKADAARVREVLVAHGGLADADALLLVDVGPDAVLLALGELEARVREATAAGQETELLVWCAAHVAGGELLLGRGRLPLATLGALLQTSPASRRLALFDLSGSEPAAGPREPPTLRLETRGVPGLALFTSQARGEAAWASELTGASHLSFHVTNGLRGAADADGDAVVTPAELLAWVASRAGQALPPLEGSWPPLSRLGAQGLVLDATAAPGHYVVADPRGLVAGELQKGPGPAQLALPAGRYGLKRRAGERLRLATALVPEAGAARVGEVDFTDASPSRDPVRSPGGASSAGRHWSAAVGAHYLVLSDPTLPSSPALGGELTLHQVLLGGLALSLDGSYGWASGQLAPPLVAPQAWDARVTSVGLSALYEWNRDARLLPFAGVRLGLLFLTRAFTDPAFTEQSTSAVLPGLVAGLRVRLGLGLSLVGRARLSYLGLDVDGPRSLLAVDAGLLLNYEFGG